jgi:hypothetical protein
MVEKVIFFSKHQNIHQVLESFPGIAHRCKFKIKDANNPSVSIYQTELRDGWRETGRGERQNIYNYFAAPDTARENRPKGEVIREEMNSLNIEVAKLIITELTD